MIVLVANGVADVFDCFADFPAGLAKAFLDFTARTIGTTFIREVFIVDSSADSLFRCAFSLIQFAFNFVSVR
jgi:hypothetical protein